MLPLFISPGQSNGSSDERRKRKPHTVTSTLKVLPRRPKQLVLDIELFGSKQVHNARNPSLFLSKLLHICS